jgi:putative FmdB family regulatory protein
MPIYEYQCESCEQRTEAIQRLAEPPLTICPHCGGPLVKLLSAPAFQFKGTGWYVTDYAGKGDGAKKDAKGGDESKGSASTSTETQSAGKSDAGGDGEGRKSAPESGPKNDPKSGPKSGSESSSSSGS